jgi:peroxiredoxin family protein/TusA-related sulfurtransferase/rhodanese-related sulfurtransferase
LGKPYAVSAITGPSHASYYPGSNNISLKVTYDPETGTLLGAQAVGGREGVDKRLDVIATALAGNLTIGDLAHLDLSYAPPFGSARDVINTVGFLGNNTKSMMTTPVFSLSPTTSTGQPPLVIDVRDSMSSAVHPIPGPEAGGCDPTRVVNIPLEEMRGRIDEIRELSKDRGIITVCNLGKLSYFASRILAAYEIPVQSLQGGLALLKNQPIEMISEPEPTTPESHAPQTKSSPPAPSSSSPSHTAGPSQPVQELDVCGIACPGPIMAIRKALPNVKPGCELRVVASDTGFYNDFKSFCRVNNLTVVSLSKSNGLITGQLRVPGDGGASTEPVEKAAETSSSTKLASSKDLSLVVFSGELDKVLAAFVLANGAIAMGGKVTMFFTFWGLNALRTSHHEGHGSDNLHHGHLDMMDRMLRLMLPNGADALPLSNLQMGGLGPIAMKLQMKQKHLPNLPDLMKDATQGGVRMVACTMSMSALGILESDLISGVELGGVADFLDASSQSKTTLFI